jgi:hypothetical protein
MTHLAELTEARAQRIRDQYLANCAAQGKRPSALGLAARLGLTNTTFRRHYPDLASQISAARTTPVDPTSAEPETKPRDMLIARNAKLRRANQALTQHLRLAAAQIQRLGLDNARLRAELETSSNVTHIDRPDRPRTYENTRHISTAGFAAGPRQREDTGRQ